MLKNSNTPPLPRGRGSVSACEPGAALLSRARKQAVFRPFPMTGSALLAVGFVASVAAALGGGVERVSMNSQGVPGLLDNSSPAISADGRFVAFVSSSTNLASGDTNRSEDVFVRDRQAGAITLISVNNSGVQANSSSGSPRITPDGRYVAFSSIADNLASGDNNFASDVFVRDRQTGTTVCASVNATGEIGSADSIYPVISSDGRHVAFQSNSWNLVPSDNNYASDVFVRDFRTSITTRVSVSSTGAEATGSSFDASISADGRYVVFASQADNLVPGDTNKTEDIFLRDRLTDTTTRVSVSSSGAQANGRSLAPKLSADGRLIAFVSWANNLTPGDTNGSSDVFVFDRVTATVERVSVSNTGEQSNSWSAEPAISQDGLFVAFASLGSNLAPGDVNHRADVFVRSRATGSTIVISAPAAGVNANDASGSPDISSNGAVVVASWAENLVPGDTNRQRDIFVFQRP